MFLIAWIVNGVWLVWSPVPFETDHEPVADELVAAHAGDGGEVLDSLRLRGQRQGATTRGRAARPDAETRRAWRFHGS